MPLDQSNSAILVQRIDPHQTADISELKALTESAGWTVVDQFIQEREADPEYEIGDGKVETINTRLNDSSVSTVVFDGRLSPYQSYNLGIALPPNTKVLDRFQLIIAALNEHATSHREQLQTELASLRYELPRIEAKLTLSKREQHPGFMGLHKYDSEQESTIKTRISELTEELNHISSTNESRRESHKQNGLELVTLAGYTNSGRSSLFKRLVTDTTLTTDTPHDTEETVTVADTPLTTFEPTTRRMPHNRRDILLTDTLGFVSDTPHWMHESVSTSLQPLTDATLILLTADMTDPVPTIREKLTHVTDFIRSRTDTPTLTAFTKADELSADTQSTIKSSLNDIAPNAVITSAHNDTGLETLKHRIDTRLPALAEEHLQLPLTDNTMSVVSWIHNNAHVTTEEYTNNAVYLEFEGTQEIIHQARNKTETLTAHPADD